MICPMCDSVSLDFRTRHKKTILYTENSVGDTLPHIRNNPRLGRKKKKNSSQPTQDRTPVLGTNYLELE